MDAHKHVVIIGYRLVDLLEFEDVRRTVADLDDCLHGVPRIPLIPAKRSVVRVSGAQPRRDDCSFRVCSMRLFVWNPGERYGTVITTLPRLCSLSTYLCVSTISSRA
jgi:hypothetical protein